MDLDLHRRRRHLKIIPDGLRDLYPHDLNFYSLPPSYEITLSEFEDLALDRLKVLRIIDFAINKGLKPLTKDHKEFVCEELNKDNLKKFLRLIKSTGATHSNEHDYQARRADHISHYILRYAYCRTEELRRWFLNRELDLFKQRFVELTPQSVSEFLALNNLQYNPISEDEKDKYRTELQESTSGFYIFDATPFYKVRFTEVNNLIKSRRVFLKDGFAYVPGFELVSCISTVFRANLSEGLAQACKNTSVFQDPRINNLLLNLNEIYTGNDYVEEANIEHLTANDLNKFSKAHYPPCMRYVHESFRSQHHLKHNARLQYLLFLKAIGLSLEECLGFWKEEFTKKMDGDKFDKQYSYSVKHAYGKVGRMQSYSAYSCIKIINSSVGPGDAHGCPFKHLENSVLKMKLNDYGINSKGVEEIAAIAEKGHYQVACGKYFECQHKQEESNVISHPNQFFEDSYNLTNPQGGKTKKQKVENK